MKLRIEKGKDSNPTSYWMYCPACKDAVRITDAWGFNGDTEKPTFTPSILVSGTGNIKRCHSHLIDGVWNFLEDCEHDMAGKQVPMVELPEWLAK